MENTHHGYGDLTNLISMKRVWMTRHMEGTGHDMSSPMREILTFFDDDGKFLARKDISQNVIAEEKAKLEAAGIISAPDKNGRRHVV